MEIAYGQLKQALRDVLAEQGATSDPELAAKYQGGVLAIKPRDHTQATKEIPIEEFLSPEDKRTVQGYVTRCYGSLTTFNQLFADKDDWFVGQKTK